MNCTWFILISELLYNFRMNLSETTMAESTHSLFEALRLSHNITVEVNIVRSTYSLICLITSLCGNSFIIYAAQKGAIRLNALTVSLITIIAITDLGITVFQIFPVFITTSLNRWIFGWFFCRIQFLLYIGLLFYSLILICLMNITKAITLAYPFRANTFTSKHGYITAGVVFIVVFAIRIADLSILTLEDKFNYIIMACKPEITYTHPTVHVLLVILPGFAISFLNLLIILTACYVLIKAYQIKKRNHLSTNLQGVFAVLLITALYLLSNIPLAAVYIGDFMGFYEMSASFKIVAFLMSYLNSSGSFFVYIISIKSFKELFKDCFSQLRPQRDILLNVIAP